MRRRIAAFAVGLPLALTAAGVGVVGHAGGTVINTLGDDPTVPACADFSPNDPGGSTVKGGGTYTIAGNTATVGSPYIPSPVYDQSNPAPPGNALGTNNGTSQSYSMTQPATMKFNFFVWGDLNGGAACPGIVYTVNVLAARPGAAAPSTNSTTDPSWQLISSRQTFSNTSASPSHSFGTQLTWCGVTNQQPTVNVQNSGYSLDGSGNQVAANYGVNLRTTCDFPAPAPSELCVYVTTSAQDSNGTLDLLDRAPGNPAQSNDGTQCVELAPGAPGSWYNLALG